MSSILESAAWGFSGITNAAKKAAPKALSYLELVKLNRDIFLPITEAAVEEISVNIFGEDREDVQNEIQAINEALFNPFFNYISSFENSLVKFMEDVVGMDLDGDQVIGFNDAEEVVDDGIEEPGKPAKLVQNVPQMPKANAPRVLPAKPYMPGEVSANPYDNPVPKYNPQLARRMNQPEIPIEETF